MASFAMQIVPFVLHLLQPTVQLFIDNAQCTVCMQGAVSMFTVHAAVLG